MTESISQCWWAPRNKRASPEGVLAATEQEAAAAVFACRARQKTGLAAITARAARGAIDQFEGRPALALAYVEEEQPGLRTNDGSLAHLVAVVFLLDVAREVEECNSRQNGNYLLLGAEVFLDNFEIESACIPAVHMNLLS